MSWKEFGVETERFAEPPFPRWARLSAHALVMVIVFGFSALVLMLAERLFGLEWAPLDVLLLGVIIRVLPSLMPAR